MSQPKSGGLWARLMSLGQDNDEKPAQPSAPPANPTDNGAAEPVAAIPVAEAAPVAEAVPVAEAPVAEPVAAVALATAEAEESPSIFDFPNLQIEPAAVPVLPTAEPAVAIPVAPPPVAAAAPPVAVEPPVAVAAPPAVAPPPAPPQPTAPSGPVMVKCPICQATAAATVKYCEDCGFLFPADAAVTMAVGGYPFLPKTRYANHEQSSHQRSL